MKVSKKAVWMWAIGNLMKPSGIVILVSWFLSGDFFLYFAPQNNLSELLKTALIADKWIFLSLSAVLAFLIFSAISQAYYKRLSFSYELGDESLKIIRGFYQKKETYIPYKNIQRVDIEMSAGERFWGLAAVLVFTATVGDKSNPESAEGYIIGLRYDDAVALKDELLKKSNLMEQASQGVEVL